MAKAYDFLGQGAPFFGMGKDLYEGNIKAKELFDKANEVLISFWSVKNMNHYASLLTVELIWWNKV